MDGTLQRAVITGAASGIGAATVERLLAAGFQVAALDSDLSKLDSSPASVRAQVDVREPEAVEKAVDSAAEELGGIDAVVCCAGVYRGGRIEDMDLDDWRLVFDVNVMGTMLVARAALPHLRRAGGGSVVTVASNMALVSDPAAAGYCASKAAVLAMTRGLAVDHASEGIRFNAVTPGPTRTPMVDPDWLVRKVSHRMAGGTLSEPEEIAAAIAFLLSPGASSVVGANLVVDRGYTIH